MKIGIDGRLINQTGVGRYIRNLVRELGVLDKVNNYVIYLREVDLAEFDLPNSRWKKKLVDIPWHTVREQLLMPIEFAGDKLDLVHIPYFNMPIFYPGRMVVTIHDLIIDHYDTGKATTLPGWKYFLRRLFYKLVMWVGLHRAVRVLTVSETTKKELMEHYFLSNEKIVVSYEGVDRRFTEKTMDSRLRGNDKESGRYFLYVGNAYPHKNLEFLLRSFRKLISKQAELNDVKLVFVGRKDYFYKKLAREIPEDIRDKVVFWGEADDQSLISLYKNARALVFPSMMEGFGLPALEALALDCPVLVSDIPVFHEILGDMPTYFILTYEESLTSAMRMILDKKAGVSTEVKKMLKEALERYNWIKLAKSTMALYENCIGV